MSDRKNRDKGVRNTRKNLYWCDCWLCTDGKAKKRTLTERIQRKQAKKEIHEYSGNDHNRDDICSERI